MNLIIFVPALNQNGLGLPPLNHVGFGGKLIPDLPFDK